MTIGFTIEEHKKLGNTFQSGVSSGLSYGFRAMGGCHLRLLGPRLPDILASKVNTDFAMPADVHVDPRSL